MDLCGTLRVVRRVRSIMITNIKQEANMLVLSRKVDEKIVIGEGEDKVIMTVVAIVGGRVRLGFEAKSHIKVLRDEIADETKPATKPATKHD